MKNIILLFVVGFSFSTIAQAQTRFLLQGSDGIKLANILLQANTQKCLQDKGFKGVDLYTDARKAMIDETENKTTYVLTIDQYEPSHACGRTLVGVKELTITATTKPTLGGPIVTINCSFDSIVEN